MLGRDCSANQVTYDLRPLRLHGLITRIPHKNTYTLTLDGLRVAVFYNKVHARLMRPPSPPPINHPLESSPAAPSPKI